MSKKIYISRLYPDNWTVLYHNKVNLIFLCICGVFQDACEIMLEGKIHNRVEKAQVYNIKTNVHTIAVYM